MVLLLLKTNIIDPREIVAQLRDELQVEKRRKPRPLQMASVLS